MAAVARCGFGEGVASGDEEAGEPEVAGVGGGEGEVEGAVAGDYLDTRRGEKGKGEKEEEGRKKGEKEVKMKRK